MPNTVVHSKMGIVDANDRICQFCPKTSGMDVVVAGNAYGSGNTIQELNDNLTKIAFDKTFKGINDEASSASNKTYSTKKINSLLTSVKNEKNELTNAINNACNNLSAKLTELGVPTSTTDPNVIAENLDAASTLAYNEGYELGTTQTVQGNATPSVIFAGKTFTSENGTGLTGEIPVVSVFDTVLRYNSDTASYTDSYLQAGSKVYNPPCKTVRLVKHFTLAGATNDNIEVMSETIQADGNVYGNVLFAIINFAGNMFYKTFPATQELNVDGKDRLDISASANGSNITITYTFNEENIQPGSTVDITLDIFYHYE